MAGRKPAYKAVIGRETGEGEDKKTFWTEIGAAWDIKDGGVSVQLHALPVDGKFVLFLKDD
jgi:hypothetical protein